MVWGGGVICILFYYLLLLGQFLSHLIQAACYCCQFLRQIFIYFLVLFCLFNEHLSFQIAKLDEYGDAKRRRRGAWQSALLHRRFHLRDGRRYAAAPLLKPAQPGACGGQILLKDLVCVCVLCCSVIEARKLYIYTRRHLLLFSVHLPADTSVYTHKNSKRTAGLFFFASQADWQYDVMRVQKTSLFSGVQYCTVYTMCTANRKNKKDSWILLL